MMLVRARCLKHNEEATIVYSWSVQRKGQGSATLLSLGLHLSLTVATLLSLGLHVSLRRHCYRLGYMCHCGDIVIACVTWVIVMCSLSDYGIKLCILHRY